MLLNLTNFTLTFGEQTLLKSTNLTIKSGDKIGLIGANGSGKSSLLKHLAKNSKCYYLAQEIFVSSESTLQFLENSLDNYWEIETILEKYFGKNFLNYDKNLDTYSGGELMKIFLSLAILSNADILLLDEPTNHLDKTSQLVLSRFLQDFGKEKAFILVCHNMSFLNQNVQEIWNLENQEIEVFGGNYDFFVEEKRLQNEAKARNYTANKNQKAVLEENRKNLISGVNKNLGKIKNIQKSRGNGESFDKFELHAIKSGAQKGAKKVSKTFDQKIEAKTVEMNSLKTFRKPKIQFELVGSVKKETTLLKLENFDLYSLDNSLLIKNCNLQIKSGQKISITGDNGSGKTSLVKVITEGKPFENMVEKVDNENKIIKTVQKLWRNSEFSYQTLTQNYQEIIDLNLTLEENLATKTSLDSSQIRLQLANFLFFTGNQVSTKAMNLSGGEKARLALAILTSKQTDLLILDELTNNLDLQTLEFFVEALREYPGSLLIISHDQDFLDKLNLHQKYQTIDQKLVCTEQIFV